ncbi:hypothetical protein HL033_01105 [Neoehrlichia mikurensis]|uniref:Uncharacterized protein n=1 Tax=Neoehrlichia mikurensis TaxID=89586 RepID=A0A9Q9BQV8_9RICK|nr:hypothetical protein [Neoehrlichia mikurensis]QXK92160.1 hypothetical protein IAH97_01100 [Neoehrlichia mikurensis]QXK92616.1 hypothetical protein HUN61_01105 [Neoehrlichia mikurensis]QXK93854.1 hypothetical protein HL033_01105 [Neoehrlichia mikurensis]UTO55150.1 hypothetical protein LUA82_03025 [Neoehrlichia mikurensis]UTO56070.1 hypothetical protein LUA81_03000 [Neoehrlichia mikurensis]
MQIDIKFTIIISVLIIYCTVFTIKETINKDEKSTTLMLSSYINKFFTDPTSTTQIITFQKYFPYVGQYSPHMLIHNIINKNKASTIHQYFTYWEKKLTHKEQLLYEISKNISLQIDYLIKVKKEISKISTFNNSSINTKLSELVNIYENMPAYYAAQIFNTLDSKTVLHITSHMQKSKLLPILTYINNSKIKNITLEIYKKLSDSN